MTKVKCVKDENKKVLVKEDEIKQRWRCYFDKLFNEGHVKDLRCLASSIEDINVKYKHRIRLFKIKDAMKKRKEKVVGPDRIPIDNRKCLGDVGVT